MAKETTTKKTTTKKSTKAKEVATPEVATTVASPEANVSSADRTVADKLIALSRLQETFTKIDHIKTLRGELPLEVQDLEDEIEGMETRLKHLEEDNKRQVQAVATEKAKIQKAEERIEEYKEQLNNVKNNREYDNLSKEIEFQGLEIELSQKRIAEGTTEIQHRKERIATLKETIGERRVDLEAKQDVSRGKQSRKKKLSVLKLSVWRKVSRSVSSTPSLVSAKEPAMVLLSYPSTVMHVVVASTRSHPSAR